MIQPGDVVRNRFVNPPYKFWIVDNISNNLLGVYELPNKDNFRVFSSYTMIECNDEYAVYFVIKTLEG